MILLCYKQIILGKLQQKDNCIFYTSYKQGEEKLKQTYPVGAFYNLFDSDKVKLDKLPVYLQEILSMADNNFYKAKAGILESDNTYQKLEKLSKLNLSSDSFYITQIKK